MVPAASAPTVMTVVQAAGSCSTDAATTTPETCRPTLVPSPTPGAVRPWPSRVRAGASRPSTLIMGYWPQIKPAFYSIALFRWDINIRESAVLGLYRRLSDDRRGRVRA